MYMIYFQGPIQYPFELVMLSWDSGDLFIHFPGLHFWYWGNFMILGCFLPILKDLFEIGPYLNSIKYDIVRAHTRLPV